MSFHNSNAQDTKRIDYFDCMHILVKPDHFFANRYDARLIEEEKDGLKMIKDKLKQLVGIHLERLRN